MRARGQWRARRAGNRAALVKTASLEEAISLSSGLRRLVGDASASRQTGVEEVVCGARSVLVVFSHAGDAVERTEGLLERVLAIPPVTGRLRHWVIRVVYDGPDLAGVAAVAGMSEAEVVRAHTSATYTVGFLGFSPGFAYLFGGDPALDVPRLPTPRTSVPAGSVALAAGMTAVYPQATPGGWRLLGRSDAVMFDPGRAEPALLAPGDLVTFQAVEALPRGAPGSSPPPERVPAREAPGGGAPEAAAGGTAEATGGGAPGAAGGGAAAPPPGGFLEVIAPGMLLTVQDDGRRGWAGVGVSPAGFADRGAAGAANTLVGNDAGVALLESTLGGFRLRIGGGRPVAVTGAAVEVTIDGLPARTATALHPRPGAELAVGPCLAGARVYVAVAGGIAVDPVLGSRSTDTLSGLGPAPLRAGDRLPLGPWPGEPGPGSAPPGPGPGPAVRLPPPPAARYGAPRPVEVRLHPGPRDDWLSPAGRQTLNSSEYTVGGQSDRTGLRLSGPAVDLARTGDLLSEGMVAGAVQVPPAGVPIVFLRNHPPTGGYPVVGVVEDDDIDLLAQCRPGDRVRFRVLETTVGAGGVRPSPAAEP
jgi:KipI family sensor histidine kinase inhibitor